MNATVARVKNRFYVTICITDMNAYVLMVSKEKIVNKVNKKTKTTIKDFLFHDFMRTRLQTKFAIK